MLYTGVDRSESPMWTTSTWIPKSPTSSSVCSLGQSSMLSPTASCLRSESDGQELDGRRAY
jgi:hypothetical protein